jgi:hypothetical protein
MNRVTFAMVCLVSCLTGPLGAQTDARLIGSRQLAREGLGDSARAVAGRILSATSPSANLYPEALYTVAMVAATVEVKRLHLQRLAVEFSQSEWADDARLELAQLAYAAQELEEAVKQIERLLSDYPMSPVRAQGALWGSRAAFDQGQFPLACQWAVFGMRDAGNDVELRNRLDFQRQRCEGMMRADIADAVALVAEPEAKAPPTTGWFVQVVALRVESAASDVAALLTRENIAAAVVRDGGFFKVRAGPYPTRADASQALPGIRRLAGGDPFVLRVN